MKVCKESCVINTEYTGTINLFLEVGNSVSSSLYSHVSEQFAIFQFPLILHSIKVCALCKSCNYKGFRKKIFPFIDLFELFIFDISWCASIDV